MFVRRITKVKRFRRTTRSNTYLFTEMIDLPNKHGTYTTKRHSVFHYVDNKLHRVDGPAAEYLNGTTMWYYHNQLHRTDGPAIEYANGAKLYFQNDKLHRTDGPAVEYENGDKIWYYHGKLHRTDGPAAEFVGGTKLWYNHDELHRTDGPAIEWSPNDIDNSINNYEWYIYGEQLNEQEHMIMTGYCF